MVLVLWSIYLVRGSLTCTAQVCVDCGLRSAPQRKIYPLLASSYDGLSQPGLPVYLVTLVSPPSYLVNLGQFILGLLW